MDGVILTPLKQIYHPKGDIFHAMKTSDVGFDGFGEAYFSTINKGEVKGWKKHAKMSLNLVVPIGVIECVIYNQKDEKFFSVVLSQENYQRLTVKPGFWVAFRGLDKKNILLNIASIEHNSKESVSLSLDEISYKW
jgi:dTDP-4-dehydrorhamnose 3,5-epimerase